MINKLLELDIHLSQKLLLRKDQKVMHGILSFLAHSGDSWYIEILLFIIWLVSDGLTRTIAAFFAGSIVIQALLVIGIKFLIKRQRPAGAWGDVYRKTDPHSFPSGHAARAIMLSVIAFGFQLPILGSLILIWGIAVSLARVSLGVHFLIDIIVGWMIGTLLGSAMLKLQPFFFDLLPAIF